VLGTHTHIHTHKHTHKHSLLSHPYINTNKKGNTHQPCSGCVMNMNHERPQYTPTPQHGLSLPPSPCFPQLPTPHLNTHTSIQAVTPTISMFSNPPPPHTHTPEHPHLNDLIHFDFLYNLKIWFTLQAVTPISLKATAGLRLLPGQQATDILNAVRTYLQSFPFKMAPDAVSILDGACWGQL